MGAPRPHGRNAVSCGSRCRNFIMTPGYYDTGYTQAHKTKTSLLPRTKGFVMPVASFSGGQKQPATQSRRRPGSCGSGDGLCASSRSSC